MNDGTDADIRGWPRVAILIALSIIAVAFIVGVASHALT